MFVFREVILSAIHGFCLRVLWNNGMQKLALPLCVSETGTGLLYSHGKKAQGVRK